MKSSRPEVITSTPVERYNYYVDEAGDENLFNHKGKIIVGTPGCSRAFMVGFAQINDVQRLSHDLIHLRSEILGDKALRRYASLDPAERKTAICFHAKNDPPEVRERVFELLRQHEAKVSVAVRRKGYLAWAARNRASNGGDYETKKNAMYDNLILRVAQRRLRRRGHHHIEFARRNTSHKRAALTDALHRAAGNGKISGNGKHLLNAKRKITTNALGPDE